MKQDATADSTPIQAPAATSESPAVQQAAASSLSQIYGHGCVSEDVQQFLDENAREILIVDSVDQGCI